MANNNHPNSYDGILKINQLSSYTKEDSYKNAGPIQIAKDAPAIVMLGFVSRDAAGRLLLTHAHPSIAINFNLLPPDLYPEVQYGSEPLYVEIKITPVLNIKTPEQIKEQTEFMERILCNPYRPTDEEIWRDLTGEIPLPEEDL